MSTFINPAFSLIRQSGIRQITESRLRKTVY